jgi:hypothetical protein
MTRRLYEHLSDPDAEAHGLVRVVDESGDDYLYPEMSFAPVNVEAKAGRSDIITAGGVTTL